MAEYLGVIADVIGISKLLVKFALTARRIYQDKDGLTGGIDLECFTNELAACVDKIEKSQLSSDNGALTVLCEEGKAIAKELLEKIHQKAPRGKWKLLQLPKETLKEMWEQPKVEALLEKLRGYVDSVNLHYVTML